MAEVTSSPTLALLRETLGHTESHCEAAGMRGDYLSESFAMEGNLADQVTIGVRRAGRREDLPAGREDLPAAMVRRDAKGVGSYIVRVAWGQKGGRYRLYRFEGRPNVSAYALQTVFAEQESPTLFRTVFRDNAVQADGEIKVDLTARRPRPVGWPIKRVPHWAARVEHYALQVSGREAGLLVGMPAQWQVRYLLPRLNGVFDVREFLLAACRYLRVEDPAEVAPHRWDDTIFRPRVTKGAALRGLLPIIGLLTALDASIWATRVLGLLAPESDPVVG